MELALLRARDAERRSIARDLHDVTAQLLLRLEFNPDSEACQMDYRIITRSGKECWISHICQSVYRDDGTWIGRRESKRDITFRKEIEKAYMQANLKLNLLSSSYNFV